MAGINERKLGSLLSIHLNEVRQVRQELVSDHGGDLRDMMDKLLLILNRTLTIVARMDAEEQEAQL